MAIPESGPLAEYGTIGVELGVAQTNVSIRGMSQTAGFTEPDAFSEFYGYSGAGCEDIVDAYDPFGDSSGVALYQLNGNANDVSGNYNGTPTSVTYGGGVFGQAGVFNGSNSKIELPTNFFSFSSFTLSGWVNSSVNSDENALFDIVDSNNYPNHTTVVVSAGGTGGNSARFLFRNYLGNQFNYEPAGDSTVLGWRQYVMTYDGSTINCYINGSVVQSGNLSLTNPIGTIASNTLGESSGSRYLNGSIDQARIFNRALTPLEVEALYTEELCICDGTVDTLDILGDGSCIATYQLDGNANDLSGNYSGTPTNVSYGVGEFDLAADFNNGYIDLGRGSDGLSGVLNQKVSQSVSFWMNASSPGLAGNSVIYSVYYGLGISLNVYYFNDGTLYFFTRYSGASTDYQTVQTFNDSQWHHISVSIDIPNLQRKVYIDNVLVSTQSLSSNPYGGSSSGLDIGVAIGTNGNLNTQYYNGRLDQVRIFNKALSAGEVTTLYNETACTKETRTAGATQILGDSSCIAYYKLDGTATDETGNYSGTFTSPDYRNGEFDLAGNFTGSNAIATPVYNRPGNTAWSFSAWTYIYESNMSGVLGAFFDGSVSYDQHLFFNTYQGRIQFGQYGSVGYGENLLPTNQWLHLVYTRNTNNSVAVFVNGSQITLKSGSDGSGTVVTSFATLNLKNEPFNIGKHGTGSNYKGLIDQIRIFNKAVSQSEVTTLYNEGI